LKGILLTKADKIMLSNQRNKCPICGTEYIKNQPQCKRCNWNLTLYSRVQKFSSEQIIRYAEIWAKDAYIRAINYRKERNELRKQMEESPNFMQELFDIKSRLSDIEKQLDSLTNFPRESDSFKAQIISEVKVSLQEIIEDSLTNLSSQNQDIYPININNTSLITHTEFIDNKEQSYSKNSNNLEVNKVVEINPYEEYVIEQYYQNYSFLADHAYKVTTTKKTLEEIYLNKVNEIIFQESNQSDYLIVELKSGGFCLLPDSNFKINTNLKTIKTIFDLENYQEHLSKSFRVIQTAKVIEIKNQWQLIDKGILQF